MRQIILVGRTYHDENELAMTMDDSEVAVELFNQMDDIDIEATSVYVDGREYNQDGECLGEFAVGDICIKVARS